MIAFLQTWISGFFDQKSEVCISGDLVRERTITGSQVDELTITGSLREC